MAANATPGRDGKVQIDTNAGGSASWYEIGGIRSVDGSGLLAPNHEETTELGDDAPRREQVLLDTSLSLELTYDPDDTAQKAMRDYVLTEGTTSFDVEYSPNVDDSSVASADKTVYHFTAKIASYSASNDQNSTATLSIELQVADGAKVTIGSDDFSTSTSVSTSNATPFHKATASITGSSTSMTDEQMEVISGTSNEDWAVTDDTKNIFDPATTFTVEVTEGSGYSALNADEYTLNYLVGVVKIDNLNSGTVTNDNASNITDVRVDGAYLPYYDVARIYSHTLEVSPNLSDTPTGYGDPAPRREETSKDVSVEFMTTNQDKEPIDGPSGSEDELETILLNGKDLVFHEDIRGDEKQVFRCWITFDSEDVTSPQNEVGELSVSAVGSYQESTMSTQSTKIADAINDVYN